MKDCWSINKFEVTGNLHPEKRRSLQIEIFKQCFTWLRDAVDIKLDKNWYVLEAGQGKYGFSILY